MGSKSYLFQVDKQSPVRDTFFAAVAAHPAGICLRERTISCAPLQWQLVLYRLRTGRTGLLLD